ncbi:MAG TPA: hypothetical protein VMV86_02695 [Methanosarcinales archaeon]|nr:hypothetical protein [Methanosarcinales archaeon]
MSNGFVRVLFGEDYSAGYPYRRHNMDREIDSIMKNKYTTDFIAYVFGERNFKKLVDKGVNCVLADKKPIVFTSRRSYMHKAIAIEAAFDEFDEIVYLDWDCVPTRPLPDNFWESLQSRDVFQCPLYKCTRRVHTWRTGRIPPKLVSGGCFMYMRDKSLPSVFLDWATGTGEMSRTLPNQWNDETYYSRYLDDLMGGWDDGKGEYKYDEYFERFEPLYCHHRKTVFKDKMELACFKHPVKVGR